MNYYKWFVKDFTRMTKYFYEITRKDIKQNWEKRQQKSFEKLKKRFIMKLVLIISDLDKKMKVEANILDFAMKGVLLIKYEDKK